MTWVPIKNLGQGLNKDTQAEELALGIVSDSNNIRFRNGFAERRRGHAAAYTTPPTAPYHICHYTVGSTRYVVHAGLQKTYVDDGTTQTEITNGNNTGGIDDRWCGFVFNGIYVQNNGVDAPQKWTGSGTLGALTAWPSGYKAGFMRPFKAFLVAGDITRGGVRERGTVLWSHRADPGTVPTSWDITDATKDAGDQPLAETNGTLIDCLPLGDMNVIYKDDAIHYQQEIQSNEIFRFGRLPGDTGLLARGCVVNIPGAHAYLTPGFDLVQHSGQGPQSILDGRMRTWLRNTINSANANRSFLAVNPQTNEVLTCFPTDVNAACNRALAWNWKDNTFSVHDLNSVTYGSTGQITLSSSGDTWAGDTETWAQDGTAWGFSDYQPNSPRLVFSRSTPGLAIFDASSQDYGMDFTASLELTGLHFDKPEVLKLCRAIRPRIDAVAGTVVYIQIGAAMRPGDAVVWKTAVPYTPGTDIEVFSFAVGRYLALRIYTTAALPWRVRSCELDIVEQGMY